MSINIIGVTGPSGAGKSALCSVFKEKNIPVIDADKVYHSMLGCASKCTLALVNEFGCKILDEKGAVDRKKLSAIVFSDCDKLERLNSIVLGHVLDEIRDIISVFEQNGKRNVLVDAPTLIESGFNRECDCVISVIAPKELRIERICQRDKIDEQRAYARVNAQKDDEFYISNSSYVLTNDGDIKRFEKEATDLLKHILK